MGRATELRWKGKRNGAGEPLAYIASIPARDLDAAETAALTEEQYADAVGSGLYAEAAPAKPGKAESGGEEG